MELTSEEIKEINSVAPNDWYRNEQGIFIQPNGIPVSIKTPVVYMRWRTGGISGGSCWDSSNPQRYTEDEGEPEFKILDLVLEKLMPNISYLQYKKISDLIHTNDETEWEYYGNCTDFEIKYIVLDELIKLLKSFQ